MTVAFELLNPQLRVIQLGTAEFREFRPAGVCRETFFERQSARFHLVHNGFELFNGRFKAHLFLGCFSRHDPHAFSGFGSHKKADAERHSAARRPE